MVGFEHTYKGAKIDVITGDITRQKRILIGPTSLKEIVFVGFRDELTRAFEGAADEAFREPL